MGRKALPIIGLLAAWIWSGTAWAASDPPLVVAAKRGDSAGVATLLEAGADPDARDSVWNTALIFAARDGRVGMARLLLDAGASVNWQDSELVTPLILAAFKNRPRVVALLLEAGADVSIRDQWGRTALDYAKRRGPMDPVLKLLKAHGGTR